MMMSEGEIVRNYRMVKKKREQIGILAELNGCSREQIREILVRGGISETDLPSKPGRRRAAETEVFQQQVKKNHAKPEEFRPAKPEPVVKEEMVPATEEKQNVAAAVKEELPKNMEPVLLTENKELVKIPFEVKILCLNRIDEIKEEIANLAERKMTLEAFLETCE